MSGASRHGVGGDVHEPAGESFYGQHVDGRLETVLDEQRQSFERRRDQLRAETDLSAAMVDDIAFLDVYVRYRRDQIDRNLREQVTELSNTEREAGLLTEYVAGGERFAGTLTCLAGEVFDTPEATLQRQAVVTELLLNSFLVVDDVIDGHTGRRGSDALWYRMEQEHDLAGHEAYGIANMYQNKLLQRANALLDDAEVAHVSDAIGAAATGGIDEAIHRSEDVRTLSPEEWRAFSRDVSAGLRPPFLLPAERSTADVNVAAVRELSRAFGLLEQTIDNAVDDELPDSVDPETEILRNARRTITAARDTTAESRLFEIAIPWFFYMYFYTHSGTEIPPTLLYEAGVGVY